MSVRILIGDCRLRLRDLPDASVDSVVCDPPYHLTRIVKRFSKESPGGRSNLEQPADKNLEPIKAGQYKRLAKGFMGQTWDGGDVAFDPDTWAEVLRVLKPGCHLVAFSGTRTYHRMVCAIEDSGFEIRDQLAWVYGSGFPKSLDVSKQIDKAAGAEREIIGTRRAGIARSARKGGEFVGCPAFEELKQAPVTVPATEAAQQWSGWGTALKPSWEPICLARKPLVGSVANNVLTHGTGALNIDGCRIEGTKPQVTQGINSNASSFNVTKERRLSGDPNEGRWPANLCHDGSDEVLAGFPDSDGAAAPVGPQYGPKSSVNAYGDWGPRQEMLPRGDSGSAARFFYCAKATTEERGEGNTHPTVKPVALMRWLCRLITPKGGTVLDPFMGSGSTGLAADAEQFNFIGCELSADYAEIARRRIADQAGLFADIAVEHTAPSTRAA